MHCLRWQQAAAAQLRRLGKPHKARRIRSRRATRRTRSSGRRLPACSARAMNRRRRTARVKRTHTPTRSAMECSTRLSRSAAVFRRCRASCKMKACGERSEKRCSRKLARKSRRASRSAGRRTFSTTRATRSFPQQTRTPCSIRTRRRRRQSAAQSSVDFSAEGRLERSTLSTRS